MRLMVRKGISVIWCDFSKKSQKYNELECDDQWRNKMIKKNIGIGTIKWYAQKDNQEEYQKIKKDLSRSAVTKSLEGTGSHFDIAKMLFHLYGTEFKCYDIKKNAWCQWKFNRWRKIQEGVFLRRLISEGDVYQLYIEERGNISKQLSNSDDKASQTRLIDKLKTVNKMLNNLKTTSFKNSIMTECKEIFFEEDFMDKMDKDPMLFAFTNGVYDLRKIIFERLDPMIMFSNVHR